MNECVVFCNTRIDGGGEQSASLIAKLLNAEKVSLTTDEWAEARAKKQIWYMNDFVYKLNGDVVEQIKPVLDSAEEIYIVLNFVMGGLQRAAWLAEYPVKKVLFLNETKRAEWDDKAAPELSGIPTQALAPCVDIDRYLDVARSGSNRVRIGRHSRISLKYPPDPCELYESILPVKDVEFRFMLGHPKLRKRFVGDGRFRFYHWNEIPVSTFLANTDIFLYEISPRVSDQGPRVIVEAMAAGVPCIAENRDGMKDRIVPGISGYLTDGRGQMIEAVGELVDSPGLRGTMGAAGREIAAHRFRPENWIAALGGRS